MLNITLKLINFEFHFTLIRQYDMLVATFLEV